MVEKKMTNCPKCQKPILNGGVFTSHARFTIRCPWCQATLEINIQPKIVTEVVKLANSETYKPLEGLSEREKPNLAGLNEFDLDQEEAFDRRQKHGFRLVGYLYPEKRE